MRIRALLLLLAIPLSQTIQASDLPPHPEYSADVVMRHQGQVSDQGRFYMGKNAARMELFKAGQTQILRPDKDVIWVLMPQTKTYVEMKMQFNAFLKTGWPGLSESCANGETIEGHPTKKCRITGRFMGQNVSTTVWKARDLEETVIRNLDDSGTGMEIKNIMVEQQPAALFEPPAGLQKMTLPGDMGEMLKGMAH